MRILQAQAKTKTNPPRETIVQKAMVFLCPGAQGITLGGAGGFNILGGQMEEYYRQRMVAAPQNSFVVLGCVVAAIMLIVIAAVVH